MQLFKNFNDPNSKYKFIYEVLMYLVNYKTTGVNIKNF